MKDKTFLDEIFVLKGIAIIGVVVQHMQPYLINTYITHLLEKILYQFSIPIFMFTSGFLFCSSKLEISSFSNYVTFIAKKFRRLMVPYFVIHAIIILLKYFVAKFARINFPMDRDIWKYIIFNPYYGPVSHLWFLHILFFIFLLFPIFNKYLQNSLVLFLLIFLINLIFIPQSFYFNHEQFRYFLLFFILGYLYSHSKFVNIYSKYLFILSLGILMIVSLKMESIANILNIPMNQYAIIILFGFIMASLGTMTYFYISVYIKYHGGLPFRVLKFIGIFSTSIYLLHTIFIGLFRIIFIDLLKVNKNMASCAIFISGIIFPIIVTKYIINKIRILQVLILGIKKAV